MRQSSRRVGDDGVRLIHVLLPGSPAIRIRAQALGEPDADRGLPPWLCAAVAASILVRLPRAARERPPAPSGLWPSGERASPRPRRSRSSSGSSAPWSSLPWTRLRSRVARGHRDPPCRGRARSSRSAATTAPTCARSRACTRGAPAREARTGESRSSHPRACRSRRPSRSCRRRSGGTRAARRRALRSPAPSASTQLVDRRRSEPSLPALTRSRRTAAARSPAPSRRWTSGGRTTRA